MLGHRRLRRLVVPFVFAVLVAALGAAGTPTAATAASVPWSQVSAGFGHTCGAIHVDGSLACWGHNLSGQLGVGDFTDRNLPTPVG